jgi:mRNA interferase HigB
MRIISRQTLKQFGEAHPDVEGALTAWHNEADHAQWKSPAEIKKRYPSADILPGNRVVFNIKGNSYRLVVKIHYNRGIVYIRFVGTHAEYGKINAEKI